MTATMPARTWGEQAKPEPPVPLVIVSSRTAHSVPRVPAAVRLVSLAESLGWTARTTYAHARIPGRDDGTRDVHSVAVRLDRQGCTRAVAVWWSPTGAPGKGWRFMSGWTNGASVGARALAEQLRSTP